jgi:hypothetical protein
LFEPNLNDMKNLVIPIASAAVVTIACAGSLAYAGTRGQPSPPNEVTPSSNAAPSLPRPTAADHAAHDPATHDHDMDGMDGMDMGGMDMGEGASGHQHALPPLGLREGQATAAERAAAAQLLADTKAAVAPYQDIDNAKAGGFTPNRTQVGNITVHYPHAANRRDDLQLDPAHPEGLMYRHNADGTSTLLAVVYTASAGEPAPTPAGPIFSWHTHQACDDFFVEPGECTDNFRMLHVWVADGVVDPFAGTFREAMGVAAQ